VLASLLSALHVLSLGVGLGAVFSRGMALRALTAGEERSVGRVLLADNFWGAAAVLWIATGLTRLFSGLDKTLDFYLIQIADRVSIRYGGHQRPWEVRR
jgi:putative membrane protein